MELKQVESILCLADIKMLGIQTIPNQYWPDVIQYKSIRDAEPWYEVTTKWGRFKIGWRKRVMSIEWEQSFVRGEVTKDDVTKSPTMVHAYSFADAVRYMTQWRELAEQADREKRAELETEAQKQASVKVA